MQFIHSLAFVSTLLCLSAGLAAADRYPIQRRASVPALTTITSASTSPIPVATQSGISTFTDSSTAGVRPTSISANSSSTIHISVSTTLSTFPTNTTNSTPPSVSIFNATLTPDDLPLTPEITPGFAVAGIILLLSGTIYALIGIRNKWLHIGLSAAYLSSLAVTVLIVYVMNPPISNGIQGAYVVAIVLTGLIFGAASLLLTEITEGLGCIFGGFCVAMWLLVLKPGGLLSGTGPLVAFIVCFSLAGWATSFSSYTRPYGLIGLLSFGGATVVVMGIDCFSGAGLKEFWAYIWNLNQNLFPLGATTYPMTKGMKVEIAAIVIIFLIGIASQSKIWNIVKTRRERRALERLPDRRDLRGEEEKAGRKIENATARQREYWEAIYGSRDNTPSAGSAVDSITTGKEGPASTITSMQRSTSEPVEMDEISTATATTHTGVAKDPVSQGVVVVPGPVKPGDIPAPRRGISFMETRSNRLSQLSTRNMTARANRDSTSQEVLNLKSEGESTLTDSKRDSKIASNRASRIPDFVPLPFTVNVSEEYDSSSVATIGDDKGNRLSRQLSQGSELMKSLSQRSHSKPSGLSKPLSNSTEQLVESQPVEDDRSSIAATVDDLTDDEDFRGLPQISPKHSHIETKAEEGGSEHPTDHETSRFAKGAKNSTLALVKEPVSLENDAEVSKAALVPALPGGDVQPAENEVSDDVPASDPSSYEPQAVALTKEALPPAMPRVASSYRTNEWAKHVTNADVPEVEDPQLMQTAAATEEFDEAPTRVVIKQIQQLPENVEESTLISSRRTSQIVSLPSPPQTVRKNSYQSLRSTRLEPATTPHSTVLVSRPVSQQSTRKQHNLQGNLMRSYRNSSTPNISEIIVESPIEDHHEAFPDGNTLIVKRDAMLRNKVAFGSGSLTPTSAAVSYAPSLVRSSQSYNALTGVEKVPNSNRPSMIRQSSSPVVQLNVPFDSHQPRRQSSTPVNGPSRDMQLAQWRASVQQDLQENVKPKKSLERSRSALLQERMMADRQKEMEQTRKGMRDTLFDERMRKGDMLEAHKEAMKKMQKEANKHLS